MYLKSIEVQGFKSFANKLLFEFHNGITGIVGPNGSGKSNVADAVRWVLGEQSAKQLRGSKMEDVIFSGTEARKPLSYAYVAITINNEDKQLSLPYEEVTVARRVYRSGESEYLINGSGCRLKDVQELFFDTGIGKEGYSIIGQGQIDKILSGKPEDRRELFDEAAGIVKFKRRKGTAERNLEEERQNLLRVNDIISELEKQVAPLEKQSEKAKEFLHLKELLKTAEINLFLADYEKIQDSIKEIAANMQITNGQLVETKEQYQSIKAEYEDVEKSIEEKNQSIDEKKNQYNDGKIKLESLEGQIKVCQEQIIAIQQGKQFFQDRIDTINKSMIDTKEEYAAYETKKTSTEEKIKDLEKQIEEKQKEWNQTLEEIQTLEKEINESNSEKFKYLNENSEIKTNQQKIETLLEQNTIKKAEFNQKLLQVKSEITQSQEMIVLHENELEKIRLRLIENETVQNDTKKKMFQVNSEIEKLNVILQEAQKSYHISTSRLDSLKNITERYEGYGQSIRRVMEKKNEYKGIHGVVADIIQVPKEYEIAVETALGGSIQNIVTDDENTAKHLIEYLKKNRLGRATFLPLTTVGSSHSGINPDVLKEENVIGTVSSLVKTEARYKELTEYLLGRIVLVKDIDSGIALAKKYHHKLRIVTAEGDQLNPGGSMSGGAFKNSSNLLGRRREMDDLKEQIQKISENLSEIRENIEKFNLEKQNIREQNKSIEEEIQKVQIQRNTERIKYDQSVLAKEEKENEYNQILLSGSEIENQRKILADNMKQIQLQLQEIENRSNDRDQKIVELTKVMEEKKELEKDLSDLIGKWKLDFSSLTSEKNFIIENIKRISASLEEIEVEWNSLLTDHDKSDEQVNEKQQEIDRLKTNIESLQIGITDLLEMIEIETKQRDEILKSQKDFFNKSEDLNNRINNLDKELYRLGTQDEKSKENLDTQISYMWQEYELTYHSAMEYKPEEKISYTKVKEDISLIKKDIRSLGDVNVNAIEDYKNVKDRYELLKTQHDDLIESEQVLNKIIEDLDEEMRKQFNEKFAEIKIQFDQVFKELFGGGKGTLELVEEEDVLEAGIRIIAQPPGKKLQNMMQLSGGEKALTAISLLFAIQNLKPSPFCLLDEIEAALDDSNVKRFAKYLHKLTKNTQFIVITHRQGTMSAADALYGITMQEKGVSTLVSVKLIEEQLN